MGLIEWLMLLAQGGGFLTDRRESGRLSEEALDRINTGIREQLDPIREQYSSSALDERIYGDPFFRVPWGGQSGAALPGRGGDIMSSFGQLFDEMPDLLGTFDETDIRDVGRGRFGGRRKTLEGLSEAIDQGLGGTMSGISGEISAALGNIGDVLGKERLELGTLFDMVDLPEEADFSARLGGRLAGIGASSAQRESLQRQSIAGEALRRGDLAGGGGALEALEFKESSRRGLEAGSAQAEGERALDQFQRFRGGLQAELGATEANINAALAQAQAAQMGSLAGIQAGARKDFGLARAQGLTNEQALLQDLIGKKLARRGQNVTLRAQDIGMGFGRADLEQGQFMNLLNSILSREGALSGDISQLLDKERLSLSGQLGTAIPAFQGIAGHTPMWMPQSQMWQQMFSNYMAANQDYPEPKGGFSFQILGTGAGKTCLHWATPVLMRSGWKPLLAVRMGEKVLGGDGCYHEVIARDFGRPWKGVKHYVVKMARGTVIGTGDHVVNGRRLDAYATARLTATPWQTGDLMLKGNVPYTTLVGLAQSAIGSGGLELWRKVVKGDPRRVAA